MWDDMEKALDLDWAQRLGVDLSLMYHDQRVTLNGEVFDNEEADFLFEADIRRRLDGQSGV